MKKNYRTKPIPPQLQRPQTHRPRNRPTSHPRGRIRDYSWQRVVHFRSARENEPIQSHRRSLQNPRPARATRFSLRRASSPAAKRTHCATADRCTILNVSCRCDSRPVPFLRNPGASDFATTSMEHAAESLPPALSLLHSERPRNVNWFQAAALLFGDWGTSRLYVLGLAFLVAGRSSFWLILGMSALILAVGWAYTQICRIYPDGGGVYTAGRKRSAMLGVVGALLLFADYTVTASLSAVDAFHYFGLGAQSHVQVAEADPGDDVRLHEDEKASAEQPEEHEKLWSLKSPGFWAIVSIIIIGAFNLMGPKHTAGFAIFAAAGMIAITLLVVIFALPRGTQARERTGGWCPSRQRAARTPETS